MGHVIAYRALVGEQHFASLNGADYLAVDRAPHSGDRDTIVQLIEDNEIDLLALSELHDMARHQDTTCEVVSIRPGKAPDTPPLAFGAPTKKAKKAKKQAPSAEVGEPTITHLPMGHDEI